MPTLEPSDNTLVTRSILLFKSVDSQLKTLALKQSKSKNELICELLAEKLSEIDAQSTNQAETSAKSPHRNTPNGTLVARSINIPAKTDVQLRTLGFQRQQTKNELIHDLLAEKLSEIS